jgi:hypothetical protein
MRLNRRGITGSVVALAIVLLAGCKGSDGSGEVKSEGAPPPGAGTMSPKSTGVAGGQATSQNTKPTAQ